MPIAAVNQSGLVHLGCRVWGLGSMELERVSGFRGFRVEGLGLGWDLGSGFRVAEAGCSGLEDMEFRAWEGLLLSKLTILSTQNLVALNHQTLNLGPETLNPKPQILNPKP